MHVCFAPLHAYRVRTLDFDGVLQRLTSCQVHFHSYDAQGNRRHEPRLFLRFLDSTERTMLEQRKDEFISMTGYELKTLVTTLKSFTNVLLCCLAKPGDT